MNDYAKVAGVQAFLNSVRDLDNVTNSLAMSQVMHLAATTITALTSENIPASVIEGELRYQLNKDRVCI